MGHDGDGCPCGGTSPRHCTCHSGDYSVPEPTTFWSKFLKVPKQFKKALSNCCLKLTAKFANDCAGTAGFEVKVQQKKKLLVLDLDETLLHSSTEPLECADVVYDQPCSNNETNIQVYVKLRPFLHVFLEYMSNYYDLAIFTAAHQDVSKFFT